MRRASAFEPFKDRLRAWHREVTCREKPRGRMLGEGAQLRRAANLTEVAFNPAFHVLRRQLEEAGLDLGDSGRERLALVAALLARVKENQPAPGGKSLAARLGQPVEGTDRPRLSELRFRAILEAEEPEDLLRPMARAIDLLERRLDVLALAEEVFSWTSPSTRKRWAYDYYDAAPARAKEGTPSSKKGEAA